MAKKHEKTAKNCQKTLKNTKKWVLLRFSWKHWAKWMRQQTGNGKQDSVRSGNMKLNFGGIGVITAAV